MRHHCITLGYAGTEVFSLTEEDTGGSKVRIFNSFNQGFCDRAVTRAIPEAQTAQLGHFCHTGLVSMASLGVCESEQVEDIDGTS